MDGPDELTAVWLDEPAGGGGGGEGASAGAATATMAGQVAPANIDAAADSAATSPSSAATPTRRHIRSYTARRLDMICLDSLSADPSKAFFNDRVQGNIAGVGERVVEAALMRIIQRGKLTVKLAEMFYRAALADDHKKVASFIEGLDLYAAMRGATSAPPSSTGSCCYSYAGSVAPGLCTTRCIRPLHTPARSPAATA